MWCKCYPALIARAAVVLSLMLLIAGCPPYTAPNVPNAIRQVTEPVTHRDYRIYVPSTYDASRPIALVVACHGTTPWDTATRQIRNWAGLAEKEGFIVVAPELAGTRGDTIRSTARQLDLQRRDEAEILAVVRHVRGAYNINPTRIFMSGWSGGAFAVLHTGMLHPDIFRALVVHQGNFNPDYMTDVEGHIDPYQPILVVYGTTDIVARSQPKDCLDWLYDHDAYVFQDQIAGPHRSHPELAYEFFTRVIRKIPWLRLHATTAEGNDPLTVRFSTYASFEPATYDWRFSDGETSPIASPVHTFSRPGTYTILLRVTSKGGKEVKRRFDVTVPLPRVSARLDQ